MKGILEKEKEIWKARKTTTWRSQVEYYAVGFLKGEIIQWVLEMPCTLQKPKRTAARTRTTQLAHLNTLNNLQKPSACPFQFIPIENSWGWRKYGGNRDMYEKLEICGKDSVMKVMVECHFAEIQKVLHVLSPTNWNSYLFLPQTIHIDGLDNDSHVRMCFTGWYPRVFWRNYGVSCKIISK